MSRKPSDFVDTESFNSLGIPVDDLTLTETVDAVHQLVEHGRAENVAHLVATLNVDFLVNSLAGLFMTPRHPELLEVLRTASLVTADGFPIVMLSRITGTPIRERVAGSDLVPALAQRAAKTGLSLYFLGGREGIAQRAAAKLAEDNPGLTIAGVDAPFVDTEGTEIAKHADQDYAIVERINASSADVLFIGFGNPKQELWFHRNREHLQVPVSIGIGGTFEFIIGTVKRAPLWMQKHNLEWLHRICQDPKRLLKRYVKGSIKLSLLLAPILLMRVREFADRLLPMQRADSTPHWNTLWSSRTDVIRTLKIPRFLRRDFLQQVMDDLSGRAVDDGLIMLDFSNTRSIELAASQLFFELGRRFESGQNAGFIVGVSRLLRGRLRLLQIMDVMHRHIDISENVMNKRVAAGIDSQLYCKTYTLKKTTLIYLSGSLNSHGLTNMGFSICVRDQARARNCVIDLRNVHHMESSAVGDFVSIVQEHENSPHTIAFSGVSGAIKQMFKVLGVYRVLPAIDDTVLNQLIFADDEQGN